jgi:hypothetical protein
MKEDIKILIKGISKITRNIRKGDIESLLNDLNVQKFLYETNIDSYNEELHIREIRSLFLDAMMYNETLKLKEIFDTEYNVSLSNYKTLNHIDRNGFYASLNIIINGFIFDVSWFQTSIFVETAFAVYEEKGICAYTNFTQVSANLISKIISDNIELFK